MPGQAFQSVERRCQVIILLSHTYGCWTIRGWEVLCSGSRRNLDNEAWQFYLPKPARWLCAQMSICLMRRNNCFCIFPYFIIGQCVRAHPHLGSFPSLRWFPTQYGSCCFHLSFLFRVHSALYERENSDCYLNSRSFTILYFLMYYLITLKITY